MAIAQVQARRGLGYPATRRRSPLIGDESEKHFQQRVKQLAEMFGWVVWHQLDSTGTRAGLPDLILLRPPRLMFAELKSQHGRLSVWQSVTLALLEQCPSVQAFVWRPSDWDDVVRELR